MIQRKLTGAENRRFHVAMIMDGNGRWATQRGLPRIEGHRAGASVVRQVVEAAPDHRIDILTLFAFSSDNWNRPPREVRFLMQLFARFLRQERDRCVRNGIRLQVIGKRERLSARLRYRIEETEAATSKGTTMLLRIAVDYSARDAILRAATRCDRNQGLTRERFSRGLAEGGHADAPDVDLLIRTGGEKRLSDFLLWECAYAELYFTEVKWPDFRPDHLSEAVGEYRSRDRRFGFAPAASPNGGRPA